MIAAGRLLRVEAVGLGKAANFGLRWRLWAGAHLVDDTLDQVGIGDDHAQ